MQENKLVLLMKSFSTSELGDLKDFVYSPYHNKSDLVKRLFDYLYKTAPRFLHTRLKKELIWQKVFKGESYNDVRMRKVASNLYKVCLDFLAVHQLKQEVVQQKLLHLQYLREHKLEKHFGGAVKQLNNHIEANPKESIYSFYERFCLEYEVSLNIGQKQNRAKDPNLQKISDHLDAFYLINKLKACCQIINYQNLMTSDYHIPLMTEVLAFLEKNDFSHIPMIAFYHNALLSLQSPDMDQYFFNIKSILKEHYDSFAEIEWVDMIVLAKNYCIRKANKGNKQFLEELFDLYLLEIESLRKQNLGYLSPFTYKNIVTLGIRLNKFDWTEDFLKDYKELLSEEFRNSVYSFNLSRLYFSQQKFSEIISLLLQVDHDELFMELDSKVLLMRTYYELEEFDTLYSFLESFSMFLRRKDSINYHRKSYKNLINAIRKLVRLSDGDAAKINVFKNKIENEKELIEKAWVLDKISKL